jgi:5'-AMP-activated protein kinase regulatory beta subunit
MKKIVKVAAKKVAAPKVVKAVVVPKGEVKKAVVKAAKAKTQRVTFSVRAKEGSKVFIAGSFNDWDPTAKQLVDKKGDGLFVATFNLEPGAHQYKFVIDGIWCADPECTDWVHNDHGTLNSVKNVE